MIKTYLSLIMKRGLNDESLDLKTQCLEAIIITQKKVIE